MITDYTKLISRALTERSSTAVPREAVRDCETEDPSTNPSNFQRLEVSPTSMSHTSHLTPHTSHLTPHTSHLSGLRSILLTARASSRNFCALLSTLCHARPYFMFMPDQRGRPIHLCVPESGEGNFFNHNATKTHFSAKYFQLVSPL